MLGFSHALNFEKISASRPPNIQAHKSLKTDKPSLLNEQML